MPEILLPREGDWRVFTPEAREVAERRDLGELLEVYALTNGLSRKKPNRVYEFARGVVRHNHGKPALAFHLDDMTEVTAKVTRRTYNGQYDAMYFTFTVTCAKGGSLKLDAYYKREGDHGHRYYGLGEALRKHVAARRLPADRERLRQGHEVTFGEFGLSPGGLIWKGKKPVPWERVGPARVKEGWVTVELAGGWTKKCARELGDVPDYEVFLALFAELRESLPRIG
ncbi:MULTISPECIES: DUF6585 family protein [Streptomyces]|uniref:DUF6585 family protein n=1 Tax=Streptomyces TaxID=1883 RepID=UPI00163B63C8|nr:MULTISPECIES: DUF6585 family protein [Streptomyces]MBC2874868.1 hypothetical protein [Streptomyces sp. TYQ1024]UBI37315.1 hypothetical protein K7I03_13140 [Streptomyces mobaraensis]UKW29905.1 hypothetical protein MCU78_13105 [Streptomyces sp. TYQ1024]